MTGRLIFVRFGRGQLLFGIGLDTPLGRCLVLDRNGDRAVQSPKRGCEGRQGLRRCPLPPLPRKRGRGGVGVERQADAVVGDAALREIVGADALRAVAAADLAPALGGARRCRS